MAHETIGNQGQQSGKGSHDNCRPSVRLRLLRRPHVATLAALLPEELVEIVERLTAALDPSRILLCGRADAIDQRPDAGDLRAAELVILEVDIVNDLANRAQRVVL